MVWKQDLAQIKQQLKPAQDPPAPPPKQIPPPLASQSLEDADLLFLKAMGGVAVPASPPATIPSSETEEKGSALKTSFAATSTNGMRPPSTVDSIGDFNQAVVDLKGLRPLAKNPLLSAPSPTLAPPNELSIPQIIGKASPHLPPEPFEKEGSASPLTPETDTLGVQKESQGIPFTRSGPTLMHLAAGMAIEVDGTLDLRRHSLGDAKERLKERIHDGLALHWRTLLVTLGPSEAIKQGFLAFLTTPQGQFISRYAQAPIPMGGPQAWVLYLEPEPLAQSDSKPLQQDKVDVDNK